MDASQLHVITVIFNPLRWKTRIAHFKTFVKPLLEQGVCVTLVECAIGLTPHQLVDFDPRIEVIQVRANTMAWNKENLMNIAVSRSKFKTPYIAWIDADVMFKKPNWAEDTVHALQLYDVVQPWTSALDLGPDGEPMVVKGFHVQTSFAKVWRETGEIKGWQKGSGPYAAGWAYPHPGYAWAIRRDSLERIGGWIEASGLGAGDHQMAMGFIGSIDRSIHGQTNKNYQAMIRGWAERAYNVVQGNVGYVTGTIEHLFHGAKDKRKYHERWDILIEEDYDPLTDIRRNLDGVIELAGNKPKLRHRFDQYFRQRDEDANILVSEEA